MSGSNSKSRRWPQRQTAQMLSPLLFLLAPTLGNAEAVLEFDGGLAAGSPVVRPTSVSVENGSGTLCVTDAASRTLDVFDGAGFHRFRIDESAGVSSPKDGAIDAEGRFLYIETGGKAQSTIGRLNFLGEPDSFTPERPSEDWFPLHLTIGNDGDYLTIDGRGLLTKHDASTGEVLWTCQVVESDFERIDLVGRPAQGPDGSIYIPHTGLRLVLVVTPDGETVSSFGLPGAKPGELMFPAGVAVTGLGQVLVLDQIRHRVLMYDAEHNFVSEFGRIGRRSGDLYHPISIASSSDGRVFIAQGFEGRVQCYQLLDTDFARKDPEGSW